MITYSLFLDGVEFRPPSLHIEALLLLFLFLLALFIHPPRLLLLCLDLGAILLHLALRLHALENHVLLSFSDVDDRLLGPIPIVSRHAAGVKLPELREPLNEVHPVVHDERQGVSVQ